MHGDAIIPFRDAPTDRAFAATKFSLVSAKETAMLEPLRISLRTLAAGAALMLAGCNWFGSGEGKEAAREEDPATTEALGDQIMYDPDLAGQNRADSAAFVPSGD